MSNLPSVKIFEGNCSDDNFSFETEYYRIWISAKYSELDNLLYFLGNNFCNDKHNETGLREAYEMVKKEQVIPRITTIGIALSEITTKMIFLYLVYKSETEIAEFIGANNRGDVLRYIHAVASNYRNFTYFFDFGSKMEERIMPLINKLELPYIDDNFESGKETYRMNYGIYSGGKIWKIKNYNMPMFPEMYEDISDERNYIYLKFNNSLIIEEDYIENKVDELEEDYYELYTKEDIEYIDEQINKYFK